MIVFASKNPNIVRHNIRTSGFRCCFDLFHNDLQRGSRFVVRCCVLRLVLLFCTSGLHVYPQGVLISKPYPYCLRVVPSFLHGPVKPTFVVIWVTFHANPSQWRTTLVDVTSRLDALVHFSSFCILSNSFVLSSMVGTLPREDSSLGVTRDVFLFGCQQKTRFFRNRDRKGNHD